MVKRYSKEDPHQQREAEKYGFPIPSREYITQYLTEYRRPVSRDHLEAALGVSDPQKQEAFYHRLKAMVRDGQLHRDRQRRFALVKSLKLVSGRVSAHKDGYGFLIVDEGGPDVFLPARDMRAIFGGDRVLVRVTKSKSKGKQLEGRVVEVLERNTHELVGRLHRDGGMFFVTPDSRHVCQDVVVPRDQLANAEPGLYVRVKITQQPTSRRLATGAVVAILGDDDVAGLDIELSIANHDLPHQWPQATLDEAAALPSQVTADDCQGRKDLRALHFITIDGADARDFDDAVFCEPHPSGGWVLYVAIADVSHYVAIDSALDDEAYLRGNSVYFPNRVIPMLPESLSNGLCSLNPDVDRLAMVAKMHISAAGELVESDFFEAVIHSKARETYTRIAELLNDVTSLPPHLLHLHEVFRALLSQREQRGALDFDGRETRIVFTDKGKIERIVPVQRNDAHRLIEECMLIANVAVAKRLSATNQVSLYRVHQSPQALKIEQLREYLGLFGLQLRGGNKPSTADFSALLHDISKRTDRALLQKVILRVQQQAVYATLNEGHFGLGYEAYTHFTSPIRRYPDLIVHRLLKQAIKQDQSMATFAEKADGIAEHCGETERRADLATREATDRLKCDFIKDKVGGVFSGTICEVTNFGIFVELDEYFVQGLVHVTALENDYYQFDESHYVLQGQYSGRSYRLLDRIDVVVARVDVDDRKIDFSLP